MKKISVQTWIVLGTALLYFAFFSVLSICAHRGFQTQMNDLGNMDLAFRQASKGNLTMPTSNLPSGQACSRLAIHTNFIFWLLAPLYWVWPNPEILLILTSFACALSGVGLYFFSKQHLGSSRWNLVPAFAFWLSPLVHDANLYDFHILTVTTALIIWTAWAFDSGRLRTAWILLGLAVICQEDIPMVTFFLGLYLVFTGKPRRGIPVMVLSVLYTGFLAEVILPFFRHGQQLWSDISDRYSYLGYSPEAILMAMIKHPEKFFSVIIQHDHLRFPIYLLICGAAVGVTAWPMLLLILPQLSLALLSETSWSTRVTGTYYWVICEAVIIMACVLAAKRSMKKKQGNFRWQLAYLGTVTVVLSLIFSPTPYGMGASWDNYAPVTERKTLNEILRIVPENAEICVQNNIGPQLSQRPFVWSYPHRCEMKKAKYMLFYLRYTSGRNSGFFVRTLDLIIFQISLKELLAGVEWLIRIPGWRLVVQKDGFYLFGRGASSALEQEEALRKFREDADIMEKAYKAANQYYIPWSGYLTGGYARVHF